MLLSIACGQREDTVLAEREKLLSEQLNSYIDSCWNSQNIELFREITVEDFSREQNGIGVAGNRDEMEAHMQVFFTAFPDLEVTLKTMDVKKDKAFLLWQASGTNTGVFGEVAPTGKKVKINGLSQIYFETDGKIIREVVYYNELDLLQQLGYALTPPILD